MTGRVIVGGAEVDLLDRDGALTVIRRRLEEPAAAPLGVVSVNLDHIHHLRADPAFAEALLPGRDVEWLALIDGAPIARRATRLTGRPWPRLAGSDLIEPVLRIAEGTARLGVLGGTAETHALLRERLAAAHPDLALAGTWAPTRAELADETASRGLAAAIADAGVDVLLVALGKPRQELWIDRHGSATGARVLLAFGAVVDFLAGRVARAPEVVAAAGLEWAWRLALEPRRLARRYLIQGPPALAALRTASVETAHVRPAVGTGTGTFVRDSRPVDVAVVIVAYRSAGRIEALLESLRAETSGQTLRVIVVDNDSPDDTAERVAAQPDVVLVRAGGNLGYAGGINAATRHLGAAAAVLVLNPDLTVLPGAVGALRHRLAAAGAAAAVPALIDDDGAVSASLRREPTVLGMLGDALVGSRLAGRPAVLSETVHDRVAYRHPHPVDWATGAALLVDRRMWDEVGPWDETFFLYSEETDFLRRIRDRGGRVWFEPRARMRHSAGGSGGSPALHALLAVNKARYAQKHMGPLRAEALRSVLVLHETLRRGSSRHELARRALLDRESWSTLPRAEPTVTAGARLGAVIVPAHQEEAVIARTLHPLAPLAVDGVIELIVSCNGCTDRTAEIARSISGVRVLESAEPGKAAALNRADAVARAWPRLYLDADIELPPSAVLATLSALTGQTPAARPAARYDTAGASPLVRAYYRARTRLPGPRRALWGAGVYGLSRAGHERIGAFPPATADDLVVDSAFHSEEKRVLDTAPARVRVPRTAAALLAVLRRGKRGDAELSIESGGRTSADLLRTVRGPSSLVDALAYAGFAIAARRRTAASPRWARDETRRS